MFLSTKELQQCGSFVGIEKEGVRRAQKDLTSKSSVSQDLNFSLVFFEKIATIRRALYIFKYIESVLIINRVEKSSNQV